MHILFYFYLKKELTLLSCSRNAGVLTEVEVKQTLIGEAMDLARAELDSRTGETDSEAEAAEPQDKM